MKLNKIYIEKLKSVDSILGEHLIFLSDNVKNNLYEDIIRIDFNNLYANILIGLFDECLLDEKWRNDIDKIKWFLENRKGLKLLKNDEYQKWKLHCNSLYAKIRSPYVVGYMNFFYNDLIEKYKDLIIYIDTDMMYVNIDKTKFQTEIYFKEIDDFIHDVESINYLFIENKKRYIQQNELGEIQVSGFRDGNKKEYLISLIKSEYRNRKLKDIGI